MREEQIEDRLERMHWEWRAQCLKLEQTRVPKMRELLRDLYLGYLIGSGEDAEDARSYALVARYLHALPDSDLRFRLVASFVDLDVLGLLEDYVEVYVGCDSVGFTAASRFRDMHGAIDEGNVD